MTSINLEIIINTEIHKLMLPPAKVANSANQLMKFTRQEVKTGTAQNRKKQTKATKRFQKFGSASKRKFV